MKERPDRERRWEEGGEEEETNKEEEEGGMKAVQREASSCGLLKEKC